MTTAILNGRLAWRTSSIADAALPAAARLWYLTAVAGQVVFALPPTTSLSASSTSSATSSFAPAGSRKRSASSS